jgi:hypothetical protein
MSEHIDFEKINGVEARKVWSVSEFCRRFQLSRNEEERLMALLGPFATDCELRMNASHAPRWR